MSDIRSRNIVYLQLRFHLLDVFLGFGHLVGVAIPAALPLLPGIIMVADHVFDFEILSALGDYACILNMGPYFWFFLNLYFFKLFFCHQYLRSRRRLEVSA